jgi:hypothetical protein
MTRSVPCPCCGRDHVRWAKVKPVSALILVCRSCEAVWLRRGDVGAAPPLEFGACLANLDLADDWANIKCLGPLDRIE